MGNSEFKTKKKNQKKVFLKCFKVLKIILLDELMKNYIYMQDRTNTELIPKEKIIYLAPMNVVRAGVDCFPRHNPI
jgi:hypothetical protein